MESEEYGIDYDLLAGSRAHAAQAIARAERLRGELYEADRACLNWHREIHEIVTRGRGSAADHRLADAGLPWNFDAMRKARPGEGVGDA